MADAWPVTKRNERLFVLEVAFDTQDLAHLYSRPLYGSAFDEGGL